MKVAFVCNPFSNLFRGGAEVQLDNTMMALEKQGVIVDLISYERTRSLESYDLVHFFRVEQSYKTLSDYLNQVGLPYVVSPIMFPDNYLRNIYYKIGAIASNTGLGRPLVIGEKVSFLRDASVLYPNTVSEASVLRKLCPRVSIELVPNCAEDIFYESTHISTELFYRQVQDMNMPFVLNVARIEPRKNQLRLIKACNEIGIPLVLIGSIRNQEYWSKCKSEAKIKLIHLDQVTDKNFLISAYKACSVFALPSTMETPGLVAMEAALQGCAIAITNRGGTLEYFQGKASFLNPFSVSSIIEALLNELKSVRQSNSSNIPPFLSYSDIAGKYIESYAKLLKRGNHSNS
jgi:glycosyltransferase involved in cell wall biosynthesis